MPLYTYKCPLCDMHVDVRHSIAEIDNPNEDTIRQITCNQTTCKRVTTLLVGEDQEAPVLGTQFIKVPSAPSYNTFDGKSSAEKKQILQERSNKHFRKRIHERKMNMDGLTGKQS